VPGCAPFGTAGRVYGRPDPRALARTGLSPIRAGHDARACSCGSSRRSLAVTHVDTNAHADASAHADADAHAKPERDNDAITCGESIADARPNAHADRNSVPSMTGEGEPNTRSPICTVELLVEDGRFRPVT
jgi:hypothetical protein